MATSATNTRFSVCRTLEIRVCRRMTLQAFFIGLLRSGLGESKDLRWITTCFHMLFAGTMTALAGDSLTAMQQCKTTMRILCELLVDVFMAGCAAVRACEILGLDRARLLAVGGLLLVASGSAHTRGFPEAEKR